MITLRRASTLVLSLLAPATTVAQHSPKVEAHAPARKVAQVERHGSVEPARDPVANGHAAPSAGSSSCSSLSPLTGNGPVVPETAGPGFASFVDPSVRVSSPARVMIGCRSFVAPFASLDGSEGPIAVGDETNIQDNVLVSGMLVVIGDHVSIAHGATLIGPVSVGARGGKPAFVGFNSYVDGAIIEPDAMVTHLVKVSPGLIIRSGIKVLPGKWIRTQAEADDPKLGQVTSVTDADRAFMAGVLHVNTFFASGYTDLYHSAPGAVRGAGRDPGHSDFNHDADQPTFAGKGDARPDAHLRVIGGVEMADSLVALERKSGRNIAIRADEGEHFHFGIVERLQDRVTFHALEHTDIRVGDHDSFGYHVVVHGGPDDGSDPHELTKIGDDVTVKDWAVVFRSKVGNGVVIGTRAYVDGSHLVDGSVVPDRAIMIKDKIVGYVEW
jgi:carbonic anhydrase/acetyltransferase-like protein (isoleucine patch superfamily)